MVVGGGGGMHWVLTCCLPPTRRLWRLWALREAREGKRQVDRGPFEIENEEKSVEEIKAEGGGERQRLLGCCFGCFDGGKATLNI